VAADEPLKLQTLFKESAMTVSPYVNFDGRCEEAIEFYKKAIGAEVNVLMRYKDAPPDACAQGGITPGMENKVMHAELQIGESKVMMSDCHCTEGGPKFEGISLGVESTSDSQAAKIFGGLSGSGKICVPMNKTFFASSFGVVTDRFGVNWMVVVQNKR
jgi:PhnB protein